MRSLPLATPGSRLEFSINPTITALTPLNGIVGYSMSEQVQADHLNTDGLLDVLSVDFSRALKDLAAVLNDLKRLSGSRRPSDNLRRLLFTSAPSLAAMQIQWSACATN